MTQVAPAVAAAVVAVTVMIPAHLPTLAAHLIAAAVLAPVAKALLLQAVIHLIHQLQVIHLHLIHQTVIQRREKRKSIILQVVILRKRIQAIKEEILIKM